MSHYHRCGWGGLGVFGDFLALCLYAVAFVTAVLLLLVLLPAVVVWWTGRWLWRHRPAPVPVPAGRPVFPDRPWRARSGH